MKKINFKNRLYEYEKIEWDKIQNFVANEKYIVQTSKSKLHKFRSIEVCEPIEIYQAWKYADSNVEFEIVCLQYNYSERENIGDGQIGHPSRVSGFQFTSFWFTSEYLIKLPEMIIEPATLEERLGQILKIKPLFSKSKFPLKYRVKAKEPENSRIILTKYIRTLFEAYHTIWFESIGNAILVRDDRPIDLVSFKKKFTFTKEIVRKITERDFFV